MRWTSVFHVVAAAVIVVVAVAVVYSHNECWGCWQFTAVGSVKCANNFIHLPVVAVVVVAVVVAAGIATFCLRFLSATDSSNQLETIARKLQMKLLFHVDVAVAVVFVFCCCCCWRMRHRQQLLCYCCCRCGCCCCLSAECLAIVVRPCAVLFFLLFLLSFGSN